MARIELMPGIASISGTVGDFTFRTINGKTYVHRRNELELPEDATREEKRQYRRQHMIRQCVRILQDEMGDFERAIQMRLKLKSRIEGLYDKYCKEIKAPTKLQRKIMQEYRSKWSKSGESLDKGSM